MLSKLPIIASSQSYLNPLNNAKTILLALVGAGGVIVLIFAGVSLGQALEKKDQNGAYDAIWKLAAGGVMVGISVIVTALGG